MRLEGPVLGRSVPELVKDSQLLRRVLGPFAYLIAGARPKSNAWLMRRRDIADARAICGQLLAEHHRHLAAGSWRLLLRQKKRRRGRPVRATLVHESVALSEVLDLWALNLGGFAVWFDDWEGSLDPIAKQDGALDAKILMPRASSGNTLLFDLDRRSVLRLRQTVYPPEYERQRRSFSSHVRSVPFDVLPDRRGIVEPFVSGHTLAVAGWGTKVKAIEQVLQRLPEVSLTTGFGDSVECLTSAIDDSDEQLGAREHRAGLSAWLGAAPVALSHGDLHPGNVRITDAGPVCVDLDSVSARPAWVDGLTLVMHAMSQAGKSGEGDPADLEPALHRFLQKVIPTEPPPDWRQLAQVAFGLVRAQAFG